MAVRVSEDNSEPSDQQQPEEDGEANMAGPTIRVPESTREILRELSRQSGEPISDLVARAVEKLRREYFLEATNKAFAMLREDSAAWDAELRERAEWDPALSDGQDDS